MKMTILSLIVGAMTLSSASAASAQISVNLGIIPCGYSVYGCADYAPPAAAYLGGGAWGGDRGRRGGGRHDTGRRGGDVSGHR